MRKVDLFCLLCLLLPHNWATAQPALFTIGQDGHGNYGTVTRFDLTTLQGTPVTAFNGRGSGLACGSDGKLYASFTGYSGVGPRQIVSFNLDGTGGTTVLDFASTPALASSGGPEGLAFGPDRALYFITDYDGGSGHSSTGVWRLSLGTNTLTQVVVPPFYPSNTSGFGVAFLSAAPFAGQLIASGGYPTGKIVRVPPPFNSPQAATDFITSATYPAAMAVDSKGNIFVAQGFSPATSILKFAPDGTFLKTVFTNVGDFGSLAFDAADNLYAALANSSGLALTRIAPDGTTTPFGPAATPSAIGVTVCPMSPSLIFPIQGSQPSTSLNPFTTPIAAVIDHDRGSAGKDIIVSYAGERGRRVDGTPHNDPGGQVGFRGFDSPLFVVNGKYTGGKVNGDHFLFYESSKTTYQHSGYDYEVAGVVIAPTSGKLVVVKDDPINAQFAGTTSAWCSFHTFKIVHDDKQESWFLHTSGDQYYNCQLPIQKDIFVANVAVGEPLAVIEIGALKGRHPQ